MDVAELVAYLGLAIDEEAWNRGQELIEKARHGVEDLGQAQKKHHKQTDEEKSKFGELNEVLEKGLETLIGYEGVKTFGELLEHTSQMVFQTGKMAQRIGVTTEALQGLQYAASQSDVSVDSLQYGLQRLAFNLSLTGERGQFADQALRKIGTSRAQVQAALKGGGGLDGVLGDIADKFKAMPDGADKAAIAMQLFGRTAGPEMIPLLNKGKEGIGALREEAEELGATMGEEDVEKVNDLEKAQKRLHARMEGLKFQLIVALIPAIHAMVDAIGAATKVLSHNTPVMIGLLSALSAAIVATAASAVAAWLAVVGPFLAILGPIAVVVGAAVAAGDAIANAFDSSSTFGKALIVVLGGIAVALGVVLILMGQIVAIAIPLAGTIMVMFGWVAVIGAVIAAVILLYRHWDAVVEKLRELWDQVGEVGHVIAYVFAAAVAPILAVVAVVKYLIEHFDTLISKAKEFKKWGSDIIDLIPGVGAARTVYGLATGEGAGAFRHALPGLSLGMDLARGTATSPNHVEVHNNVTINTGASKDDVKQAVNEHFDRTMVHTMNAVKKGG